MGPPTTSANPSVYAKMKVIAATHSYAKANTLTRFAAAARIARWLGPWAAPERVPTGVQRRRFVVDDRIDVSIYTGPKSGGLYVIAPGLQPRGADDPRLDRFARILARAGITVAVPSLPDYARLRIVESVCGDFARVFDAVRAQPEVVGLGRPHVLAISFGVLPALRLAASDAHADHIGGVVVFGGYADWRELAGNLIERCTKDPRDLVVAFTNLLPYMPGAVGDREGLEARWLEFAARTWGRPEMNGPDEVRPVAEALAQGLSAADRTLFLRGCGVEPGGVDMCLHALAEQPDDPSVDPRVGIEGLRCRVTLVHALDDDVIPVAQVERLASAIEPHAAVEVLRTGLFSHAGALRLRDLARLGPVVLREAASLLQILATLTAPYGELSPAARKGPRRRSERSSGRC